MSAYCITHTQRITQRSWSTQVKQHGGRRKRYKSQYDIDGTLSKYTRDAKISVKVAGRTWCTYRLFGLNLFLCVCFGRNQFQIFPSLLFTFQAENWTTQDSKQRKLTSDNRWLWESYMAEQKMVGGEREWKNWSHHCHPLGYLVFALHLQIEFIGPRWNWRAWSAWVAAADIPTHPTTEDLTWGVFWVVLRPQTSTCASMFLACV